MGTSEESEPGHGTLQLKKEEEVGSAEKDAPNSPVEQPAAEPQEDVNLLNTYVWHTGAKPPADTSKAAAGAGGQQGTMERPEKSKWSKMQSWRKALSEDPGDRGAAGSRGGGEEKAKQEKQGALRKNPFRRALSEPPGALLSVLSSSSSAASPSTSASASTSTGAEASGSNTQESAQKGKFLKYLQNVSRKIKRPRLQSRNSTPIIEHGENTWLFKHVFEPLPQQRAQPRKKMISCIRLITGQTTVPK